jgi:rhodanese-related sulfurtransferase/DNA-binding transcriptional ArsR family regulator
MDKRAFKDRVYSSFAEIAKGLASPKRVELVELLSQADRTVEWLAGATGMSVANTSQHLQVLRGSRLVESRREGSHVFYRIASPAVASLLLELRRAAEDRDAEIDRVVRAYFGDREGLDPVPMSDLLGRVDRGEVVIVDVRPREEFAAAHIAGAIGAPLDELAATADQLPSDRVVVAYCRGPYCVLADEAVRYLRSRGFDARRLDAGLPEWRDAGLPTVAGA